MRLLKKKKKHGIFELIITICFSCGNNIHMQIWKCN